MSRVQIPDEITTTFSTSKNKFLYFLISERERHYSKKTKRSTTLSKLQYNVDLLINELNKCDLHYVRCIKPQYSIHSVTAYDILSCRKKVKILKKKINFFDNSITIKTTCFYSFGF